MSAGFPAHPPRGHVEAHGRETEAIPLAAGPAFTSLVPPPVGPPDGLAATAARSLSGMAARHARATGRAVRRIDAYDDWDEAAIAAAAAEVFSALHRQRIVRRRDHVTLRCPECRRSPEAEPSLDTFRVNRWTVKLLIEGESARFVSAPTGLPETLCADVALAVGSRHPRAAELEGRRVHLPLTDRQIPILLAEDAFVGDPAAARRVTPAYEPDSLVLARRHELDPIVLFDERGLVGPSAPPFLRGLDRHEARLAVLALLEKENLLGSVEEIDRTLPICAACRCPLEPEFGGRWRARAIEAGRRTAAAIAEGRIDVRPAGEAANLARRLGRLRPWILSSVDPPAEGPAVRIPAWRCGECGAHTTAARLPSRCARCGGERLTRDRLHLTGAFLRLAMSIVRTGWLGTEATGVPVDLVIAPAEQRRAWLDRLLVLGEALAGGRAAKRVLLLETPSAGSPTTSTDPIETSGSDALRLALAVAAGPRRRSRDLDAHLRAGSRTLDKLWNLGRLLATHGGRLVAPGDIGRPAAFEDRWALAVAADAVAALDRSLADARFDEAALRAMTWIRRDLGRSYIRFLRGRRPDDGWLTVLGAALEVATAALFPLCPAVSTELRERLGGSSPIRSGWPAGLDDWLDPDLLRTAGRLEDVLAAIRRTTAATGARPERVVVAPVSEAIAGDLAPLADLVARASGSGPVEVALDGRPPAGARTELAGDVLVHVVGEGPPDRDRLRRQLDRLEGRMVALRGRLMRPSFHEGAAASTVEVTRERLRTRLRLRSALDSLL